MKKRIPVYLVLLLASLAFFACNDDENGTPSGDPLIGTWKLTAMHTDGAETPLDECGLMETYIFGEEQFSHELFNGTADRPHGRDAFDSDDEEDEESDEETDEESDEPENDEVEADETPEADEAPETDENESDEESDDDPGNGSNCASAGATVGFWTTLNSRTYTLTSAGEAKDIVIYFENDGTRFYYDETVVINGQEVTRRYFFQKQ
ncbi:lipocalin family protein [uncultured Flavobacterium sp.]|uniref:lipocalin family protein n=1 Tax=uncultured Flavobacterium sp. TaxID=165435 RepID=UPI0025F5B843|nr:lipocalin family protein [uncultured Flavobacterium sp.]